MPDTNSNAANSDIPSETGINRPGNDMPDVPDTPTTLPIFPSEPSGPSEPSMPSIPTTPSTPSVPWPGFPGISIPSTPSTPSITYYGQVRFLNASTNGVSLDVLVDGRSVLSGSTFATVSSYIRVTDGFHTVVVRQTRGPVLYQQTLAFVAGEKVTMVILDTAGGATLAKVSDMGCTNVPSGYGCIRVANMSYSGSSYDIRLFNNQIVFAGVSYRDVTSFKQASAGNYSFFVTGSQANISSFGELPVLVFAIISGSSCLGCAVNNPLLTYSVRVQPGNVYTSYIIGNPWSNLFRVFTLED